MIHPLTHSLPGHVVGLIARQLALASTGWSIGVPGALAEYCRDPSELHASNGVDSVISPRGALRLTLAASIRPVAYEILSSHSESWYHGIALCLPSSDCAMHRRHVITELGPDADAIWPEDRDAILFDLGLNAPFCDFHVHVSDPAHISRMYRGVGTSLFDSRHGLYEEIPHWSPHRVFASRLGRIEVYQHIGTPGGATPDGPHTYVLPKLLRTHRTHSANIPIPVGWIPCATLYPANPVRDSRGIAKPFDAAEHSVFQSLHAAYGEPAAIATKACVWESVRSGAAPGTFGQVSTRFHRIACRIALRRMLHSDGASPLLAAWRGAFDPAARTVLQQQH